ncbi:MAG: hypothetical protein KF716_13865 [Anaerolineae bacterium]|nr:hypothetical protein [Anaerolineae bacterium]
MTSSALGGSDAPTAEDEVLVEAAAAAFASTAGRIDITAVISLAAAPFALTEGVAGAGLVTTSGGFSAGIDVDD